MNNELKIEFGRFKGTPVSRLPEDYLKWLVNPVLKSIDGQKTFDVPKAIRLEAALILGERHKEKELIEQAQKLLSGEGFEGEAPLYVIEDHRYSENDFTRSFAELDEALAFLDKQYPLETVNDEDAAYLGIEPGTKQRQTPDPQKDQILIWEVLPSGHRKVVWHFSGYRFNEERINIEQGKLPGDKKSLYEQACEQEY